LQIVDLGAGTGANLRFLAPRIGGAQDWLLIEHGPQLIEAAAGRIEAWAAASGAEMSFAGGAWRVQAPGFQCRIRCVRMDLAAGLGRLPLAEGALVTASALLDLASEQWLNALARRCAEAKATVSFALTYDGRIACTPSEPEDRLARDLLNRHQLRDKGLGPALGAAAAVKAAEVFERAGYRITSTRSDWRIGPGEQAMQHALLDGWFNAAREIDGEGLQGWREKRRRHIRAGLSHMVVGHVDLTGRLRPGTP
jgi:hypothetical protein